MLCFQTWPRNMKSPCNLRSDYVSRDCASDPKSLRHCTGALGFYHSWSIARWMLCRPASEPSVAWQCRFIATGLLDQRWARICTHSSGTHRRTPGSTSSTTEGSARMCDASSLPWVSHIDYLRTPLIGSATNGFATASTPALAVVTKRPSALTAARQGRSVVE